jgi:probable rRNA maturation factor
VTDDDGGHPPRTASTPSILVSNRQDGDIDEAALIDLASRTLIAEGHAAVELSLSFVTDEEIAELHERFMAERGPTDVLSFPLDETDVTEDGLRMLGDVVIAPAVAAGNNPQDPPAELRLLVVHGVLHILGYDHEDDGGRAEMWARQERYSGVTTP